MDNVGEFNNQAFQDMEEKFNIRVMGTNAENPFRDCLCEHLKPVKKIV